MLKKQDGDLLQLEILMIVLGAVLLVLCILVIVIFPPGDTPKAPEPTEPAPTFAAPEPNPYGPEDFAEVNGYLACVTGPYSMGVDVSEFHGPLNWEKA